jgi:hypothetical protein
MGSGARAQGCQCEEDLADNKEVVWRSGDDDGADYKSWEPMCFR